MAGSRTAFSIVLAAVTVVAAATPAGHSPSSIRPLAVDPIDATAQYAHNHNQRVGLIFWGVPPLVGWNPFTYTARNADDQPRPRRPGTP